MKTALITGIAGQDGSYLAELLLEKGYDVHGVIRRSSVDFRERIAHLEGRPHFHLHYADMTDSMSLVQVVGRVRPDEIYNLAAQSHVQVSFDSPEYTANVDATGVLAYWKPSVNAVWKRPAVCIRPPHPSCTEKWRKCLRMRTLRSILIPLMQSPNSTASG